MFTSACIELNIATTLSVSEYPMPIWFQEFTVYSNNTMTSFVCVKRALPNKIHNPLQPFMYFFCDDCYFHSPHFNFFFLENWNCFLTFISRILTLKMSCIVQVHASSFHWTRWTLHTTIHFFVQRIYMDFTLERFVNICRLNCCVVTFCLPCLLKMIKPKSLFK